MRRNPAAEGVYLFDDEEAARAYLEGPIVAAMKSLPVLSEFSVKSFSVLGGTHSGDSGTNRGNLGTQVANWPGGRTVLHRQTFASLRTRQIKLWPDGNYLGRIDVIVGDVVMLFDVVEVDGLGDSGLLI